MLLREAGIEDISQMQIVRNAVKENRLSNPDLITDKDCEDYITRRGKGWVYEINKTIVGFAIVSVQDKNVWALFVQPGFDKKGIGKKLHDKMINWYFLKTSETVWLSTAPGTRAEIFYRKSGWKQTGVTSAGEIRFEMTKDEWQSMHSN
ncbi:MAG TPA: GNAT family N-acetyltransferase [Chitinophagaceae bacterium]|nr:GNAT family N-acetyltransferase [Chitinophagaceae bacterium]